MSQVLQDAEFGSITVRRSSLAKNVSLKVDHKGTLVVSMPKRAPLYLAKQLVEQTRHRVRQTIQKTKSQLTVLQHGDMIGKSHKLVIRKGEILNGRIIGTFIEVTMPANCYIETEEIQDYIKQLALKALRSQAKSYLARQLGNLAGQHGFSYENVRFSNAGTRWGSCSSSGTISLNIWLMQLPFELIDYVIIHELCHTREMNHSRNFWQLLESILPDYRERRRALKDKRPYL